jgi:hypothetical protein
VQLNRNSGEKYQAKSSDCKECALPQQCIWPRGKSPKRTLYLVALSEGERLYEQIGKKLDEVKYRVLYGRRKLIEPCFSDMRYCKGMDRLGGGRKTLFTK